ncbi:MAG: hypothetical protein EP305_13025 [Bacteroidetes bacterium]|nr:MAG: hypothetical protein EP305_13025 [Bacteroidota bacterium]
MIRGLLTITLLFFFLSSYAQRITQRIKLDRRLSEISGIDIWQDTLVVAVNDGGNLPVVYFLNLEGEIVHEVYLKNARNKDWEDLTIGKNDTLYIGDFGNNLGNRKDRAIYKLDLKEGFKKDTLVPVRMGISFEGQPYQKEKVKSHPYDCESIFWKEDTLWMISKNRISKKEVKSLKTRQPILYALDPVKGGKAIVMDTLNIKRIRKGYKDQVTSADAFNSKIFFLTYDGIYEYKGSGVEEEQLINFKKLTQKEALVFINEQKCLVAAEYNRILGGPYLYTIEWRTK